MLEQFLCLKIALNEKNWKSDKTISNRLVTAQFEMNQIQKLFVIYFCNHKIGIVNMHFLVKAIYILFKKNKFHLKFI